MKLDSNRIPFSPQRWPFFYGWFILAAGTLGIVFSAPGQTIGVTAFTEPLIEALRIDRTSLSIAYGIGTAASGLMLTFVGRLYDRIGARWSGAMASLGLGATLLGLSQLARVADALSASLGGFSRLHVTMAVAILGFFFLRMLGQGMLTIVSRNMVMKWFEHRRGLANGLMGLFIGFAFSASPPIFNGLIKWFSWQGAWAVMGLAVGVGFTIFAVVFYRDNPEACGLLPEGGKVPRPQDPQHAPVQPFTLGQAARTRTFWIFAMSLSMLALYITAFAFHVESLLGEAGFDSETAYKVFMPSAVISVTLGLVAGWISDHVNLKHLLMLLLAGMAISMVGLLINDGWTTFSLVVAGNGLSSGMFGLLLGMTWPRFFGRRHLGAISGLQMTFNVIFSAIGPAAFALSLHYTGSYHLATSISLGAVLLLLLQAAKADRPRHPEPAEDY